MIIIYKDKWNNIGLMYKNGVFQEMFLYDNCDHIALDALRHNIEFHETNLDLKIFEET